MIQFLRHNLFNFGMNDMKSNASVEYCNANFSVENLIVLHMELFSNIVIELYKHAINV